MSNCNKLPRFPTHRPAELSAVQLLVQLVDVPDERVSVGAGGAVLPLASIANAADLLVETDLFRESVTIHIFLERLLLTVQLVETLASALRMKLAWSRSATYPPSSWVKQSLILAKSMPCSIAQSWIIWRSGIFWYWRVRQ